jgi:DNA polymerase-1
MFKKSKIKRITPIGVKKVCDITVAENHSYVGNGFVNHNSSGPNLQNIINNWKFPVRCAFKPKKGYKFLVYDWSTIEIRIMAHESRDPVLLDILQNDRDIHQETTDYFNEDLNLEFKRKDGKTFNFAIMYLMSALSLANTLNRSLKEEYKLGHISKEEYESKYVTEELASKLVDSYFGRFKGFAAWQNWVVNHALRNNCEARTISGRRRMVPMLRERGSFNAGKRRIINTVIQGGAADLMKRAIVMLQEHFYNMNLDANVLMYVHDEFVIECRSDQAEECANITEYIMENIFPQCLVPIKVEGGIYDNWGQDKNQEYLFDRPLEIEDMLSLQIL